jgi:type IV pilus assembly protein PilO
VVSKLASKDKSKAGNNKDDDASRLVMEAVAKTYRYLDASEIAAKREAELQAKKGKGAKNAKAKKK